MRCALVLVLVAGCRAIFGISDPGLVGDASTIVDGHADGGDAPLGCTSFSTLIDTCKLSAVGPFPPSATLYDSDTGLVTVGAAIQPIMHQRVTTTSGLVDAIPVTQFIQDVDASLRMVGSLPVAFVATGEIEISGHLDVSAGGAGAGCDVLGTGKDGLSHGTTGDGAGGGGGAVAGAAGGASNGGNTRASGGSPQLGFAGGCAGGDGGLIDTTPIADGGGVVYLISAQPILVIGVVDASGAGGRGGVIMSGNHGGGGGGGGGGSLVLEAPSVMNAGQINATGGGGGGGSSLLAAGNPGKLGSSGGQGGSGTAGNGGGRGGNGPVAAIQGADGASQDGGGGGGGATGRIHIIGTVTNTGTIAPPAL